MTYPLIIIWCKCNLHRTDNWKWRQSHFRSTKDRSGTVPGAQTSGSSSWGPRKDSAQKKRKFSSENHFIQIFKLE